MRDENDSEAPDEPELAGYEPHDRPLRSPHLMTVMRVFVVLGLAGLILPGVLVTAATANGTAQRTCAIYTAYYAPEAVSFTTRFEVFSPAGIGWNCYAVPFAGDEVLIASLGLIPGGAKIPYRPPTEES